jgi:hypothetical protein
MQSNWEDPTSTIVLEDNGRGEGRLGKKAGIKESIAYPWCWRRRPVLAGGAITPPIVLSTYTCIAFLRFIAMRKIIRMNLQILRGPLWTERDILEVLDE